MALATQALRRVCRWRSCLAASGQTLKAAPATPDAQRPLVDAVEEVVVNYRSSPIVGAAPELPVMPGDALPAVPGTDLWDVVSSIMRVHTGHVAIVVTGSDGRSPALDLPPTVPVVTVAAHAVVGGHHVADPNRAVAARIGAGAEGRVLLVRPDGYVAHSVALDQVGTLHAYLLTVQRTAAPALVP